MLKALGVVTGKNTILPGECSTRWKKPRTLVPRRSFWMAKGRE
jgi:hypothetical protein